MTLPPPGQPEAPFPAKMVRAAKIHFTIAALGLAAWLGSCSYAMHLAELEAARPYQLGQSRGTALPFLLLCVICFGIGVFEVITAGWSLTARKRWYERRAADAVTSQQMPHGEQRLATSDDLRRAGHAFDEWDRQP